jgi:hypothetical protein
MWRKSKRGSKMDTQGKSKKELETGGRMGDDVCVVSVWRNGEWRQPRGAAKETR